MTNDTVSIDTRSPAGSWVGGARFLLNAGVFAVTAAVAAFGLSQILEFPPIPIIGEKLRYFASHKDDYDVLFVGSSRFFHQIVPKQFDDSVAAKTGMRLRSLNLACDSLWPPESFYFLRKLFAMRPRLKWVVIELMNLDPKIDPRLQGTRRVAYWHDWKHTRLAWDALGVTPFLSPQEIEETRFEHARLFVDEWFNLGRGAEWTTDRLGSTNGERPRSDETLPAEGYRAGGENGLSGGALNDYLKRLKSLHSGLSPVPMTALFERALGEIVTETRAIGAEPVFVISPTVNKLENFVSAPGDAPLLAYNDPRKYPTLFDPILHYDAWHLNPRGAVEFTRLLAEGFAGHLHSAAAHRAKPVP